MQACGVAQAVLSARPHGLHGEERIALTRRPGLFREPGGDRVGCGAAHQRAHEHRDVGAVQRRKPYARQPAFAIELGQHLTERTSLAGLLFTHGNHEQQAHGRQPVGQEPEQPQAQLVGPVSVLDDHQERSRGDHLLEQVREGLEQAGVIGRSGRVQTPAVHLRKQPRQLRPPHRRQRLDDLVAQHAARAGGVEPGAEGQDLLRLVAPPDGDVPTTARSLRHQLLDEPALADAGLAEHDDHLRPARPCRIEGPHERVRLRRPADQRDLGPGHRTGGDSPATDGVIQVASLDSGLPAKLAAEDAAIALVLPQRRRGVALLGVEPHDGVVRRLLQGVEGQQPGRGLQRGLNVAWRQLLCQQLLERGQRQRA